MSVKSLLNVALAVSISLAIGGCGGKKFETAPTQGTVTFNGKKVTGGTITLSPVSGGPNDRYTGRAAIGTIQSDGSFVLTTYDKEDGAIIGKHQVSYSPPENEGGEDNEGGGEKENTISKAELKKRDRSQKFSQLEVAETSRTVEITAGDNTLKIELSKKEADEGDGDNAND